MANRKVRRALAKEFPSAFAVTDVTNGTEFTLHIASQEGRPILVIHEGATLKMAVPALQIVHAISVMMEEAYEKAKK